MSYMTMAAKVLRFGSYVRFRNITQSDMETLTALYPTHRIYQS